MGSGAGQGGGEGGGGLGVGEEAVAAGKHTLTNTLTC